MATLTWLLLAYKVPPEPARTRVALWRKLKGMGAVYLQNGVCLLPKTEEHLRKLKLIENDIASMVGDAVLLETISLDQKQEEKVINRFKDDRDESYKEFVARCTEFEIELAKEIDARHFTYAELETKDEDLNKLRMSLEKIQKLDFYGAPLAHEAISHLKQCEMLLESYARQVFAIRESIQPDQTRRPKNC